MILTDDKNGRFRRETNEWKLSNQPKPNIFYRDAT